MKKFFGWSFLVLFLCSVQIDAQTSVYSGTYTLGPNWAYSQAMNNVEIARIAMQGSLYGKGSKSSKSTKSQAPKKLVATGISAFKADQPYILPKLISENYQGKAQEKKDLQQTLKAALDEYHTDALNSGFPSNDLAFAMSYFIYNNFAVYNRIQPFMVDDRGETKYAFESGKTYDWQVKGLYQQFSKMLSGQADLKKLNDEQKQQIAEYLAMTTVIVWHAFDKNKNSVITNHQEVGNIKATAKKSLESLVGDNVDKMQLTESGIQIKTSK